MRSAKHALPRPRAWMKLLWQRIDEDALTVLAGHLAYVSLLSLVPLIAVVLPCSAPSRCSPTLVCS